MRDPFGREITYLRVSVTDRCNLRCRYCMPPGGVEWVPHRDILSFEEISGVVRAAVDLGVEKVRLTGGEPLARKGVVDLVAMISRTPGLRDLSMTTNGTLLSGHAAALARAGLRRVNVSLDSADPARFREITRGGDLGLVLRGLDAARAAGLSPVKLNCVVESSPEESDARGVALLARERGLEVRFIPRMDLRAGKFSRVIGGHGGNCARCNRLRLTSRGKVKPCLFSDVEFGVRELGAREALLRAVGAKPEAGTAALRDGIHAIGG
jgi:cyclic pyranopterin phosphate synthase